jgi:radical SAM protein with 4Fe4S-binding SPASM domain
MQNLRFLRAVPTGLSYLLAIEKSWGSPLVVTIETINVCNFRCIYCPQSDELVHFTAGTGIMPLADFQKILANLLSAFKIQSVSLQRDGEPLLNPRIDEYVSHVVQHGIVAGFSTNCSKLSDQLVERLLDAGLTRIKTDFCVDPGQYESLRVRGSWSETLDGMRRILAASVKKSIAFRLAITDLGVHRLDLEESRRSAAQLRALFAAWPDRIVIKSARLHNALGESIVTLATAAKTNPDRYCRCHQPWVNLVVDFAGRVVCCGRDLRSEVVLGNLLEQPAETIWNGEAMRHLRRSLIDQRQDAVATCQKCDVPWSGSYSGQSPWSKALSLFFDPLFKM